MAKSKVEVDNYGTNINKLELSEKDEKDLEKAIQENVNKLYKSAIEQKAFNDIKGDFEYKGSDLSDLEDAYESFARSIKNNELTAYDVTDVEVDRLSVTEDGFIYVTVSLDYKYSAKEYFSEGTVSDTDTDIAYLTFDYSDGFKLVDMTSLATYFSRF